MFDTHRSDLSSMCDRCCVYVSVRLHTLTVIIPTTAAGGEGGQREVQRLQGVCSGSVGTAGGRGTEAGGVGRRPGERTVSQMTSCPASGVRWIVGFNPVSLPPPGWHTATSVAPTPSAWPLLVWLNMSSSSSATAP